MKKPLILLVLSLILISCEKKKDIQIENLVPQSEIPVWLKEKITADIIASKTNQYSSIEISAWIRYKYEGNYFFENHNLLSSSFPPVYNFQGSIVPLNEDPYLNYQNNKCCKQFVWKGSSYIDF
ncbi:MAG: hypothetical protein CVU00_08765 [Bacteroidetes bacterium HGW-Bacteroidetes-17]|jgi:hypothetical protein|nr:MAG: hypothetical protein CVU00_08765 [Bacteroidetes bacterium HGW-Bacteroidetes-17]